MSAPTSARGSKAEMLRTDQFDAPDPQETLAGLKSCSAAISWRPDVCYLRSGTGCCLVIFHAMPASMRGERHDADLLHTTVSSWPRLRERRGVRRDLADQTDPS